jgi:hypothetical protein
LNKSNEYCLRTFLNKNIKEHSTHSKEQVFHYAQKKQWSSAQIYKSFIETNKSMAASWYRNADHKAEYYAMIQILKVAARPFTKLQWH